MAERLKTVLGKHGQLAGVRQLEDIMPGVAFDFVDVKRMPDAYRDMARTQPYDICEMAPTMYLMALERGARITALPLPMTRRFRHSGIKKRKGLVIDSPKQLEGRKVGVRNYSVTAAVWTRGVFADDYGLDASKVQWVTEEAENLEDMVLPANVTRLPEGRKIADAINAGEIDVAFDGLAGAGDAEVEMEELVADAGEVERRWFERTGIYPIHGVIVVKNEVLARHPGIGLALYEHCVRSKDAYLQALDAVVEPSGDDKRYRKLRQYTGDPLPYGFEENRTSLQALIRYAHQQGLVGRELRAEDVFIDPRTATAGALARWE
ncbi:substrate-binding domain-containing protein [Diaphorobacter caeni]|uniref:ABC transporter substrate-binding protein n=1 Tax=Diaphorobacter caeni TaxID=2784387 RepID=UPI00188FEA2E|nr:ABC transporter substrate-binding protein [Diaphorobacter caeni]MBF5004801.1 ABC transporter substrate-binding protein [Diaphorobacter caeni]